MNSFNRITHSRWRQGNALVLVTAMLVLLVLIATAYLSRTQSQRGTAAAMQDASGDTRRVEMIQKQIASEIAMHLFVKPIDSKNSLQYVGGDSAGNRIAPGLYSVRYGIESASKIIIPNSATQTQGDLLSSSVDPSDPSTLTRGADGFPDGYNFAPYSVIPWTNWPDYISPVLISSLPTTPPPTPNFSNIFSVLNDPNGNPLGNPGFGDTRWLRSTEPVRMVKLINQDGVATPTGDQFSHWPHLSWLPTPANGYRLVTDIADIETNTLTGPMPVGGSANLNDAFGTPYEQWLPNVIPAPIPGAGTDPLADNTSWSTAFINRRKIWFTNSSQSTNSYQKAITSANAILTLPNFIKLDDPLGVGRTLDPTKPGVSKSEEWVDMTPRNVVSRTFCDTDGDGFTDSFWFLAPVGKERNVRTVVGVSVIDNASMVDVNVATRADRRTTVGFTPSDLALVTSEPEGSRDDTLPSNSKTDTLVGLFDNPSNQSLNTYSAPADLSGYASPDGFIVQFDPYRWAGYPIYYDSINLTVGKHDVGQPSFMQTLGLRSTNGQWNDYFYGAPVVTSSIVAPTNEPFSGDMRDRFGPSGPSRPDQENPTYRQTLDSNTNFRSSLPNQPLVRPSERARWFRSAATGQGTLFAEALNVPSSFEQAPANDVFGIAVPTRRFDASDELELRANAGNNDPSSMSRLERSLNSDDTMRTSSRIADTILRSTVLRGEAGSGQEQLTSPQLIKDLRRKITVLSGQRNELMPPWLWIGRPYGVESPDPRETYQNAMLWLGLHPETPGPRDENGNGRLDSGSNGKSELGYGKLDLYRIAMSNDAFQDGNISDISQPTPIDSRDFSRAVRYFEELNSKLDLRKPLLVTRDLKDTAGTLPHVPDGVPDRNDDGSLDQFMAITVNDQRLAMNDFVREARGRLRAALRIHSPMTPLAPTTGTDKGFQYTEVLGINDTFASYTDRFYEQFLFTTNAQTLPTKLVPSQSTPLPNPDSFQIRIQDPNEDGKRVSVPTLGQLDTPATTANQAMAYRSAWSTEALTASMAANIATWRSRADLIYSPTIQVVAGVVQVGPDPTLPLRAIHQPILPDVNPISLDGNFLRPYLQSRFDPDDPTPDPSTHPKPDPKQKESPLIPPLATRAVDPSKKTTEFENNNFTPGTDPAAASVLQPNGRTADIVFPGIEKHPFFTEVFFGWVYPATTAEGAVGSLRPDPNKLEFAQHNFCKCPEPSPRNPPETIPVYKFVALVNGKVGIANAQGIEPLKFYSGLTPIPDSPDTVTIDTKRDQLNEIRTPVLVVQVANPWNEPIRLGDFRINMFGTDYDFPDYELDSDGTIIKDRDGKPVPLMLAAATETEPSTATVYLIANVLGNTDDATSTSTNNYNDSKYDEYSPTHNPPTGIQVCKSTEGDLTRVAMWDPLFRRRWLDYFDLFEFSDSPIATSTSWFSSSNPVEGYASKLPTSPKANPLFWYTNKDAPSGSSVMPRSKLLNAMHPIKGKKTVCDTNADGLIDDVKGNTFGTYDDDEKAPIDIDDATVIYDKPELTYEEDAPNSRPSGPVSEDNPTGISVLRHSTLQRFKNSLTKQNLSLGITLHRVLKNPAAVDLYKRQNLKSEISTDYFLTDSTPQSATSPVYQKKTIKHWVDVTLEVDRFDAHSDFDHWTTTGKKTLIDLPPRVPEDPANNPPMFADNRNFDTNLVTGGRFWTAAARITLPPSFGPVTKLIDPADRDQKTETIQIDLTNVLVAGPNDSSGWPIAPNGTMTTDAVPVPVFPTASDYFFDGPGASQNYFPPPTAKPLVRSKTNPFRLNDIIGTTSCPCGHQGEFADSVTLPIFPGIILGESDRTTTPTALKRSDADYFTTWTHVSRSWSRLFDAKFVTVPTENIAPVRQGYSPEVLASVTQNLPVWNYTRQLVVDSNTSSFESNPIVSDAVLPAGTTIESRSPTIPKERSAPRFIFSNRTEPETTNRPLILQPARHSITSLWLNKKKTTGQRTGTLPQDRKANIGTVETIAQHALGDVFSLSDSNYDYNLTAAEIMWSDPDVWHPPYDNSIDNPTWGADLDYNWMRNQPPTTPPSRWAEKPFMMLLSPVWAPLPDFCGLGLNATLATNQSSSISPNDWPTLVLRKPTSFNCQTVFCAQFPNEPIQKDGSPTNPAKKLTKHVVAYYDNPLNKPEPYVQDADDALPLINVPTVPSTNTQFVLPQWAAPSGSGSATPPTGTIDEGPFRVYMADKSARLLDHDGLLLPIDLASGSEVVPNAAAIPPVLARPWLARGLWNTLDRIPQAGSLQMLQKDDDFEQIGELLDVFAWGPAYRINLMTNALAMTNEISMVTNILLKVDPPIPPTVPPTPPSRQIPVPNGQSKATFSEIMSNRVPGFPVGEGPFINRIQVDPLNVAFTQHNNSLENNGAYQFGGTSALRTPYAPNVPWGMRIFDCFTVDGAGAALRFDWTNNANATNIALGGSASTTMIADRATIARDQIGKPIRPVGALVPVDVRSTINTSSTTTVTPQILAQWEYDRSPSLSGNFAGLPTKGLLNINTASIEVMKTLPHMTQMVYDDTGRFDGPGQLAPQIPYGGSFTEENIGDNPAVLLASTIEIYRNQLNPNIDPAKPADKYWQSQNTDPMSFKTDNKAEYPTYIDRGKAIPLIAPETRPPVISLPLANVGYNTGMQSQRGLSSVGEIIGMARGTNVKRLPFVTPENPLSAISARRAWSVRFAGLDPREFYPSSREPKWVIATRYRWGVRDGDSEDLKLDPLDARLSTDRQGVRQFDFVTGTAIKDREVLTYDSSYGDSEELNLLFKGISNLVTTRSDVFTVYFKVRTVKQNPTDGKWNGTDRESVLDDARYVMCVDRSNVNRPSDEPRIVYFSRVPD